MNSRIDHYFGEPPAGFRPDDLRGPAYEVDIPSPATLEELRAWAMRHGTRVEMNNPPARFARSLTIVYLGRSTVMLLDKWPDPPGLWWWSSTMPVDFMARCVAAYSASPEGKAAFATYLDVKTLSKRRRRSK